MDDFGSLLDNLVLIFVLCCYERKKERKMQSLQEKASEWSGVNQEDAFVIDQINLYDKLGGLQPFINLSTDFYTRKYMRFPRKGRDPLKFPWAKLGIDIGIEFSDFLARKLGKYHLKEGFDIVIDGHGTVSNDH